MGKFKMKPLNGYDENKETEKELEEQTEVPKLKLGAGLLSNVSKETIKMELTQIPREKIQKNPKNKYSIKGIDSLAESIRVYGLGEPLNVKELPDGNYMLLGGERRITAIDQLIDNEEIKEWDEYTLIPCVVKDIEKIKLDLSKENKEKYAILTTNKEQRVYSEADKYNEIQDWKEIIAELRENGVETITTTDEDGNDKIIRIQGEKTRDILENVTGMSRGQINKFEKVEKKASPSLLNAMLENNISVGVAEKAVDTLNDEEQKTLAKAAEERKINPADVKEFKTHSNIKTVTSKQFKKDIANINNAIKEGNAYLTEDEEQEYYKLIKKLESIIIKGE
ncbi:MAG: ParB N-terminal domain-containing protein [Eubacterium sp.]|jgi:ParB family chromosome partitioning protein|nr:ParB N-terminal domain-containing protein [Eubacterium sp.]